MKKLSFIAMLFLAGWTIQSCNDGSQDSIGRATESNEIKMDSSSDNPSASSGAVTAPTVSEDDAKFSVKAASGGLM